MTKETMVIIAFFAFVLIRSFIIEPNALEVVRYEIGDSQLQGIRAAFLSDFHLKRRDYKRLDKIVNLTNKQNPNIVLLGGDFANGHNIKATMAPAIMASKLSLLNAPTYAVLGNNDWWTDGNSIIDSLKSNDIKVLEDTSVRLNLRNRSVDIVGISDLTTQQPKISQALRRTGTPRIIITHNPDIYFDILDNVNLILAGHTHGGQLVIPFTNKGFVNGITNCPP